MGDARHHKPPHQADEEEDVTSDFRKQVREALATNKRDNKDYGRRKGDPGYLISTQAELADVTTHDKRLIARIIGPVRADSAPVKLLDRSAYVRSIRTALNLPEVVQIEIPASRATVISLIASLSDRAFAKVEAAIQAELNSRR